MKDTENDKIYHFWFSEKMKKAGSSSYPPHRLTYIIMGGKKKEYTEMRDKSTPSNKWDDNVYLGNLPESEFWRVFSIGETPCPQK